jgi:hypothetical protein
MFQSHQGVKQEYSNTQTIAQNVWLKSPYVIIHILDAPYGTSSLLQSALQPSVGFGLLYDFIPQSLQFSLPFSLWY